MRRCEHHTGTTPLIQLLPGDCTAPSSSRRPVPRLSRAGRCPWSVCLCLPPYPHPDGPLCPLAPCCLSLSVFTMLQHGRCRPLTHHRCSLHYPLLVTQCVQSTMLETRARQNQTGYSGVTLTICRRGFSSVHLSCSVVSDSLQPHGLQHARLPCPSLTYGTCELMSIVLVMPSNHLILCCPRFLLPSVFTRIKVFSSESVLHIR